MDATPTAYDDVAEAYSHARDPKLTGLIDPVLEELLGDVSGKEVLSLACGQGQDARLLARLGAKVTAIDVSAEMLRFARDAEEAEPRGISYVQGDAQELEPVADASFDGVVCHMALMDILDLGRTIRSVARVLREPGWFVFSIVHPCYHGHVQIVDDYMLDHRYRKTEPVDWLPSHAYHRPIAQVVNELVAAGFRVERIVEVHVRDEDAGGVPGLLYGRCGA